MEQTLQRWATAEGCSSSPRICAPLCSPVLGQRLPRTHRASTRALPPFGASRLAPPAGPASLQDTPSPQGISVSSSSSGSVPRLPATPSMGLLRPASREGTPEPIPLLPPKQAAPASSLPHSSEGSPPPPVSNKPLRASAPLITKRIKRTQTWQELEAVVAAEGRNFNHIHVSAAMVHLAKLLQGAATQEQTLPTGSSGPSSERERHGGAHGVEGSPQHGQESTSGSDRDGGGGGMISSTDESGPSRGSRGNSMSNAPGSQWAPPPSSNAQAPAPIALSPGSLTEQKQPEPATLHAPRAHGRRRPSVSLALQPPGVRALLDSLIRLVHRELQVLDVQGVANTLYTLAVLRVPDMRLVDELMRAVQYRLDMGTPQNLANIIWSCVVLGYSPDREWMVMYYNALDLKLHDFGPMDVSNTLWAFGRLLFDGKQYRVAPDIVRKLLKQAYTVLLRMEPQHLANTLWGLARLGFVPAPSWSQAFLNASGPRLLAMGPPELASLAWAAGKLRMAPGPVWVGQLLLATQPMLPRLRPHQLSQLLLGLAMLGARPPRQWMAAALHASQQHVGHGTYTPQALLQVVRGVALMGGPAAAGLPPHECSSWVALHLDAAAAFLGPNSSKGGACSGAEGGPGVEAELQAGSAYQPGLAAPAGDGHEPEPTAGMFRAEELAQLLYVLARMGLRPPQRWLGRALEVLQGSLIQELARDGPAMAMTVWSVWELLKRPALREPLPAATEAPPQPSLAAGSSTGHGAAGVGGGAGSGSGGEAGECPSNGALSAADLARPPQQQQQQQQQQQHGKLVVRGPCSVSAPPSFQPFVHALLDATGQQLSKKEYSAFELATLLHGLAGWGVVPPISWMARFWWRSLVLLSNTNTIYSSTSKRDVRPGGRAGSGGGDSASERARPGAAPASPAAAAAAAAPPPPPPPGSTGFVARAAASTLRDQGEVSSTGGGGSGSGGGGGSLGGLDVMDPRALDTMLKALVKLKARPQGYWSRVMQRGSRWLLPSFAPHQFGSVLSSMAALRIIPLSDWWRDCLLAIFLVGSEFKPKDWATLLRSLAQLQMPVPRDWLTCLFASTQGSLPAFSAHELGLLGLSLCRLHVRFPVYWTTAFFEAALPKLPQASPKDLVYLVSASIFMLPRLDTATRLGASALGPLTVKRAHLARTLKRKWLAGLVAAARGHLAAGHLRPEQERLLATRLKALARVSVRGGSRSALGVRTWQQQQQQQQQQQPQARVRQPQSKEGEAAARDAAAQGGSEQGGGTRSGEASKHMEGPALQ